MRLQMKLTLAIAMLALGLVPALAGAAKPENKPDKPAQAPKGKAYGYHCKEESKKHVKGEKGTAFSRCVKALAKADKSENLHPKKACQALSKKHVKGEKGTEFSRCVKDVNEMRKEQREQEKAEEEAQQEEMTQS